MRQTQALIDGIHYLLEAAPSALSEFELIQQLKQQGWSLSTDSTDTLALFNTHFLVFNALYQLQTQYWENQQGYLDISALHIQFYPLAEQAIHDQKEGCVQQYRGDAALRDYYLDLSQLERASHDSVNALLSQFWEKFIANDDLSKALAIFSLETPFTIKTVKQRYRQLAMAYHPDRGGHSERFQEINWAFGVLQRSCIV